MDDKNPFASMSQDEIRKVDEVLQSDQAKALLNLDLPLVTEEVTDLAFSITSDVVSGSTAVDKTVLPPPSEPGHYDGKSAQIVRQIRQDEISKSLGRGLILFDHSYCKKIDYELPLTVDATACKGAVKDTTLKNRSLVTDCVKKPLLILSLKNDSTIIAVAKGSSFTLAENKSVLNNVDNKSPAIGIENELFISQTENKSPVKLTENKLPVTLTENKSSVTFAENKSPVKLTEKKLPVTLTENKSSVTFIENESSVTITENIISVSDIVNKSAVTQAENKSSITQVENASSITQIDNKPSETQIGNKPSETQIGNKPSETQLDSKPAITPADIFVTLEENVCSETQVSNDSSLIHVKNEALVTQIESECSGTHAKNLSSVLHIESESIVTHIEIESVVTQADSGFSAVCTSESPEIHADISLVINAKSESSVICPANQSLTSKENQTVVIQNSENTSPVETLTPRRRSQRQIAKVCREELEKKKVAVSATEPKSEETVLSTLQQAVQNNSGVLTTNSEDQNDVKQNSNDLIQGFEEQVENNCAMGKKQLNIVRLSKSNPDSEQLTMKSGKRATPYQNKSPKKETQKKSTDAKEVVKIIDSKDIKAIVARSKTQRKSVESEVDDDNCVMPSTNFKKNTKNVKRRTSDSFSSTSSEMSVSPVKNTPAKVKKSPKNSIETNGLVLANKNRRASFPSKKGVDDKEIEKSTNGVSNKPRKKSLSFSEDKNDDASEKKRHLSSSGKEIFSVEIPVTKLKANKQKKRIFKPDPLSLDLLGPALFSQPHVMGKQKSEESPDTKESTNIELCKETIPDVTQNDNIKVDSPANDENELDLIRAEVKTDKTDSKPEGSDISLEKNPHSLKTDKNSENEKELPKAKSTLSELNTKPVDRSCAIPAPAAVEKIKPKSAVSSEKSVAKNLTETIKERKVSNSDKIENLQKSAEPSPKSSKTSEKIDVTVQPERKSQRNVQKRKRIYEDDSDFEEPIGKKPVVENNEIEVKETSKRSQRQKLAAKIENESDSDEEDGDYNGEEVQKTDDKSEKSDSSDEEEEEEENADEDDPNKLWCICRQPHNNKFMICCDKCEDWFHGTCVGITRKIGQKLEVEKKEWICPNCKKGITKVPEKRSNAASKSTKQETAKQAAVAKKTGNQTPVKPNDKVQAKQPTKQSPKGKINQENGKELQKSEMKIDDTSKQGNAKPLATNKTHLLKKIDERKEIVLMKRDPRTKKSLPQKPASAQKVASRKDSSPEKPTKGNSSPRKVVANKETANIKVQPLQDEKTSVAKEKLTSNKSDKTAVSSPNVIKNSTKSTSNRSGSPEKSPEKTLKRRTSSVSNDSVSKAKSTKDQGKKKVTDCIVCDEPVLSGSVYCGQACLESYTTDSLKLILNQKGFLKENEDWKTKRIDVLDRQSGTLITGSNAPALGEIVNWLRSNPSFEIIRPSAYPLKKETVQKVESKPPPPAAVDERDDHAVETMRKTARNSLKLKLSDRCKNTDDLKMAEEEIQNIATKIEEELYNHLKDMNRVKDMKDRYMKKYRTLIFNIQDSRNMGLFRKILSGEIAPDDLVKMSTEELAAPELAQWRAMENQHSLDMIKRMQVEQQSSAGVRKKTHKGEIEIEDEQTVREPEIDKEINVTPPQIAVETIEISPEKKEKELEVKEDNDTTASHRSHLFDLNCKICTGKVAPPPVDEPTVPKKFRVAHSISVEHNSPKSLSSSEKLISPITPGPTSLLTVAEASDDSADREPTSTTHSSPDSSTLQLQQVSSRKKSQQNSVWKGFVAMQDVTKFFTNAYKVSGPTDFLLEDIPDTIQVCGRIVPDQVWDYLSKIKQSGNKELIIIRFQAANEEETVQYNSFYTYLHSRKRYGVVGSSSKMIKDFYIFPLAAHNPVPTVLMPFDGPGLPSQRPHLLLGILVRHRTRQSMTGAPIEIDLEEGVPNEGSFTPPLEARSYTPPIVSRSYTPPLPSSNQAEISSSLSPYSNNKPEFFSATTSEYIPTVNSSALKRPLDDEYDPNETSYTPPQKTTKIIDCVVIDDDDENPYDPEQDCLSSHTILSDTSETPNAPVIFTQLLKKITDDDATSTDPLVASVIPESSSYLEQQRLVLDALTRKCAEADEKVSFLKTELDVQSLDDESPSLEDSIVIPNINASGMSSFLDLPQNLQEILNSVQRKTEDEHGHVQSRKQDVDQRCLPVEPKSDVDFRSLTQSQKDEDNRQLPSFSPIDQSNSFSEELATDTDDRDSSQGATPPPLCEDDDNSTSSELRPSDPRIKLRTSFVETGSEEGKKVSLSDMTTSELMERAQKELEMIPATASQNATSSISADGVTMEHYQLKSWAQYTEPPPPGIDPSELPPVENISFPATKSATDTPYASQPENHAVVTPFPPQPSSVPGFSVPPPGYPLSTPPPSLDGHKMFPPPPTAILPPTFMPPPPIPPLGMVLAPIEVIDPSDERYCVWSPENPPVDSDWRENSRNWHDREWEDRPLRRSQPDHRREHTNDFQRRRFRRDLYPDEYMEDSPSRPWQEGDRDAHFERNDRRWNRRPFRDHRQNDNFRGRRNFRRSRD